MYDYFYVWCVHVSAGACRIQKKVLGPLELDLWVVLSHLMWVLHRACCAVEPAAQPSVQFLAA